MDTISNKEENTVFTNVMTRIPGLFKDRISGRIQNSVFTFHPGHPNGCLRSDIKIYYADFAGYQADQIFSC